MAKWNRSFVSLNWKTIFLKTHKTTKDTKLQWFQYRILHRILPTNRYLHLCKIKDISTCTFCSDEVETIEHLLWFCRAVQSFWEELLASLKEKCRHCDCFSFNLELVIFGTSKNVFTDKAIDFMILFAKFYIYKCKLQNAIPQYNTYLQQLKSRVRTEKYSAITCHKLTEFERNWLQYKYLLE